MEDDLNFLVKWKTTSIYFCNRKMTLFFVTGGQPQFSCKLKTSSLLFVNGRWHLFLCKWKTTSVFRQCAASIYRNVGGWVSGDYTQKCLLSKPLLRPGWRQFIQYKCTQDCVSVRVYSVVQLGPSEPAFKTRFAFNERGISPKHKETNNQKQ